MALELEMSLQDVLHPPVGRLLQGYLRAVPGYAERLGGDEVEYAA